MKTLIILAVLISSVVALVLFLPERDESPKSEFSVSATQQLGSDILSPAQINSSSNSVPLTATAKNDNQASALQDMYDMSRLYGECDQLVDEMSNDIKIFRQNIEDALDKLEISNDYQLSVWHLHELGYLNLQQAFTKLNRHFIEQYEKEYVQLLSTPPNFKPSEDQRKMVRIAMEIPDLINNNQFAEVAQKTNQFKESFDKKGMLIRIRGNRRLVSPDVIIGHSMVSLPFNVIDELIEHIEITPLMFIQAVRSGGDKKLIERLLNDYNFTNQLVFTKHSILQTPIQAAIEAENPEVLRLLLDQPNISHTRYVSSPINTIIYKALQQEIHELSAIQIEMLNVASEFGYKAELWRNKRLKRMELAGYMLAILPDPIITQLKVLDIKPGVINRMNVSATINLDASIKSNFTELIERYNNSQSELAQQKNLCKPLESDWRANLPAFTLAFDNSEYIDTSFGFSQQVRKLNAVSPVLVDKYYQDSMKSPANMDEIVHIVANLSSLSPIPADVYQKLVDVDMNLFQRHFLAEHLCEKFGEAGIYAAFELAQFIRFDSFEADSCLVKTEGFYSTIKDDYFASPHTFPSRIYHHVSKFRNKQAVQLINDGDYMLDKKFSGYPMGRDALMVALDRENINPRGSLEDNFEILSLLLEKTELEEMHYQRLHRLKVSDILLFERLAAQHPRINSADQYQFNEYLSH